MHSEASTNYVARGRKKNLEFHGIIRRCERGKLQKIGQKGEEVDWLVGINHVELGRWADLGLVELNYHPTNHQQWMVPLGLILFVTPLIVCLAVFTSDFCNPNDPYISTQNPPDTLPKNPFHDPEM
ncbi:UNVERIFIED_CONTAM: hypothetical protein Sradi_6474200 [Sesamum radiatum]|uniref:Transmembrane protein n=1 Tax=Sesamum radiatum TaxID=300843 RepID=A0AAW2K618_SESRA